jgi:DNA ligase-1
MKPMLAVAYDPKKLPTKVWASPKLDGIRTLCMDNTALSRNLKPIPNHHIRNLFEQADLDGYDGELLLSDMTRPFNEVSSAIMSRDGEPDFVYVVFDNFNQPDKCYKERFIDLNKTELPSWVRVIPTVMIESADALAQFEAKCLEKGYEGVMIRRADGKDYYKQGRSTVNDSVLLKVKVFEDSEAVVIGGVQKFHNANEATKNALGHTERSSHKDNMIPTDTLGALIVDSKEFGQFQIGTGFDDITRKHIWDNLDNYIGKLVKFKHQPAGAKEGGTVRFPVFLGFRSYDDL